MPLARLFTRAAIFFFVASWSVAHAGPGGGPPNTPAGTSADVARPEGWDPTSTGAPPSEAAETPLSAVGTVLGADEFPLGEIEHDDCGTSLAAHLRSVRAQNLTRRQQQIHEWQLRELGNWRNALTVDLRFILEQVATMLGYREHQQIVYTQSFLDALRSTSFNKSKPGKGIFVSEPSNRFSPSPTVVGQDRVFPMRWAVMIGDAPSPFTRELFNFCRANELGCTLFEFALDDSRERKVIDRRAFRANGERTKWFQPAVTPARSMFGFFGPSTGARSYVLKIDWKQRPAPLKPPAP